MPLVLLALSLRHFPPGVPRARAESEIGGVPPARVARGGAGISPMAGLLASIAVAAPVGARADRRAMATASSWIAALRFIHAPALVVGSVGLTVAPMLLVHVGLVTYEDVAAAIRSRPFRELPASTRVGCSSARVVLVAWRIGTGALALGSC